MSRALPAALAAVIAFGLSSAASASGTVYLNGVNIDGVQNQEFKNVKSVRIDAQGNVFIDAPAYQIEGSAGGGSAQPSTSSLSNSAGVVAKRYFLVTDVPAPGKVDYDIDIFVNAKWIRKVRNEEEQIVQEITKFLQPGQNKVVFRATKRAKRTSFSPEHYLSVVIGEGNQGGDQVMIDNPLVEFRKTAQDVESSDKEYAFSAR